MILLPLTFLKNIRIFYVSRNSLPIELQTILLLEYVIKTTDRKEFLPVVILLLLFTPRFNYTR